MPSESKRSAPSSAPTSSTAPKSQRPNSDKTGAKSNLSESEFLARQANDAKAAITRVTGELAGDVARTVDPRGWVQAAPWTTLATAALVGFAGTALVVPSKEEQALRRLRKLEVALHAEKRERRRDRSDTNGHDDDESERGRHSFLGMLAGHAFQLAKPLIGSAISAVLAARTAQTEPPDPNSTDAASGGSPGTA